MDNGHAFIRIDDGNGNVIYIGFAPKDNSLVDMLAGMDVEGKFVDDSATDWYVAKTYVLSTEDYNNMLSYISSVQKNGMAYNIETCNCTTFAVRVLKTAGIGGNLLQLRNIIGQYQVI